MIDEALYQREWVSRCLRVREDDGEGCWFGLLRVGADLKERRKGSWRLV